MEDNEFQLYQMGIEIIQKHILGDPVALEKWPECIYSFVANPLTRKRLRDKYEGGEHYVIMSTLEEWLQEQGVNATFGQLIQQLRGYGLNHLCDSLQENVKDIKNSQCTSTAVIHRSCRRNFWFEVSDPIANFVGRKVELQKLHQLITENREDQYSSVALLTSVHGFGGIGKTTVARMYAWKYRKYFDGNVIWINAETFGSMRSAFQKVAAKLKGEAAKYTNLGLKDLTESVYNSFADSKCLFVFDNAENFEGQDGVDQFLPSGIIRKPYLLLTSRRKDCFETNRVLPLDVLSETDSINLVKEYIPGATYEIADKLAIRLGRLPLAIQQAIAYIKKSIPGYSLSLETYVSKEINSFLEEYEFNSNKILKSEFTGRDGYAKNIYSICAMSLQRMELEESGHLAKHMLMYISFLDPDDIQLDLLLNLDYQFESVPQSLQKTKPLSGGTPMNPNMTVDLLYSYSLININVTEMTIKVHRLVQDAMRLMLEQEEELLYVSRLLGPLRMLQDNESISHWISLQRTCRFEVPMPLFLRMLPIVPLGLNIDLSKKLVDVFSTHCWTINVTEVLLRMKCDNINESVEIFLNLYNKIQSVVGFKQTKNAFLLTNYVVFANFIVSETHKNIFQSVFECISILRLRTFKRALLLELLGNCFLSEDIFLDILSRSGIEYIFSSLFDHDNDLLYHSLFNPTFQIPPSLCNEFPCLNYLKRSSSFANIDELQALNLSWDWRNSTMWPLLNLLEFNLEAVRSAIAYICDTNCTIAKYIQNYKKIFGSMREHRQPEIVSQIINANYFIKVSSENCNWLALICCLRSEFDKQKIQYILSSYFYFRLSELDDFGIVARKGNDVYYMKKNLQVILRNNVLSLEIKTWAVKALHKACVESRNRRYGYVDSKELVKDWRHLMEQEDLKQIAINANLSLADL